MSLFRSQAMTYVQILVPAAVAEDFADRMGREGCLQFSDLNEDFQPNQRTYTGDIIKSQEVERQIKSIEELLQGYEVKYDAEVTAKLLQEENRPNNANQLIDSVAREVGEAYKRVNEQSVAEKQLKAELSAQEAIVEVLSQLDKFLAERRQLEEAQQRLDPNRQRDVGFKYFAGVVTLPQKISFERQIFLTSRGNSFIQFDDSKQDKEDKIPFVVFFLGDQLKRSLKRLCQFMNIQICYESDSERSREELLQEAQNKKNDYHRIHYATQNQLTRDMNEISNLIKKWKIILLQEKAIRITLNKCRITQNNIRCEGWIPTTKKLDVERILDAVTSNKGVGRAVLTSAEPRGEYPTYFETNDFTANFQSIVNTYGIPRYQEFNPAIPTIVTFPFLFGVMYGDIFHGSVLFLFSSLLVFGAPYLRKKGLDNFSLFGGRYVLWLMGAFAIYCGVIYNDCMSIMINGWNKMQWNYIRDDSTHNIYLVQNKVYHFGIDPSWFGVDNKLSYENSLKMKLSVIIGVTQMTFGLFIKLSNHIFERDFVSILFEFIPQLIFMLVFFWLYDIFNYI